MQGISWGRTAALAAIATASLAPQAGAATRADLTVAKLSEPPAGVQPGATLSVTDTVRNKGRRKAKATTVVYWLSADRRRNAGDVRAGRRKLKALKGRRGARGRATLTLPATLTTGAFHVIACADGASKVSERSERNNCRASRGRLTVALPETPWLPNPDDIVEPEKPRLPPPAPPAVPGDRPVPDFPLPADPLSVTHTLDTANAVTQRVQVSQYGGATVETTGADGTKFTLDLPPGSLVSPVEITMTPVEAVNGSPLSGGLIGAVEILPHGLELLQPATLSITPAGSAGPVEGQTGFLSHAQGEDFHLYPLQMGEALQMKLTHFSTPGVAQASAADRQVVLGHPPARSRAQYEQELSELIRASRAEAIVNENVGLPDDQIAALLGGYFKDIVAPLAEQAKTNDDLASKASGELIGWARQIDLLGLMEHPAVEAYRDQVWPLMAAIVANAITKGYPKCVDGHDIDYIHRLIALARISALLVLPLEMEALDKAERCANFELRFDSTIVESHGYEAQDGRTAQTDGRWRVTAITEIPLNGIAQNVVLHQTEFSYKSTLTHPCGAGEPHNRYVTTGSNPVDDTDGIASLTIDLNLREPGTPPPADRDISLFLIDWGNEAAGTYTGEYEVWCGDTKPDGHTDVQANWYQWFSPNHWSHHFDDWTVGTGQVIATKRYDNADTGDGVTETTVLEIWHKPLK